MGKHKNIQYLAKHNPERVNLMHPGTIRDSILHVTGDTHLDARFVLRRRHGCQVHDLLAF